MKNFEKCKTYPIHVGSPKDKDIAKFVLSEPTDDQLNKINTDINTITYEIEQMIK
jgi:peptidyl-tRNA hydrolase